MRGGEGMSSHMFELSVTINGKDYCDVIPSDLMLVDYLRSYKYLTGTKKACNSGECGACTVIINGRAVYSCIMLAVQAHGCRIETIEGLSDGEELHPIQQAYISAGAIQCGFCTPGFIMSTKAFLDNEHEIDEASIKEALSGNICRCTGYQQIIDAVVLASENMEEEK